MIVFVWIFGPENGGGPLDEVDVPYVPGSRLVMLTIVAVFLVLVRAAWKRNGYRDREGLAEVPVR